MVEKIYLVENGEVFYGSADQFDDCFFVDPGNWDSDAELIDYFNSSPTDLGELVIIAGEIITSEQFKAMTIEEAKQAMLDQIAAAQEK